MNGPAESWPGATQSRPLTLPAGIFSGQRGWPRWPDSADLLDASNYFARALRCFTGARKADAGIYDAGAIRPDFMMPHTLGMRMPARQLLMKARHITRRA